MHAFDPTVSHYNGHMLRNLSKYYLFICCKQSSSTHFCHFLATTFVTDVLMGANPSVMGPKTKGPHSWEPVKSVVGDEGCRVRLRRPPPLRACGPRVLRWKTLARFLSSAPCRVRIPLRWAQKRKASITGGLTNQVVGDEGCRVRLRRPLPLRRFAPRVLRWKTLRVSSAPHPAGFESHVLGTKRKASITGGLTNQVVGDEGFEPPALCV